MAELIDQVMVVGAGTMGAGIAQVCIEAGFPTILVDLDAEKVSAGVSSVAHFLHRKVEKGNSSKDDVNRALALLMPSTDMTTSSRVKFVIEAVTEDVSIKTSVFRKLEAIVGEETILASNTSAISITLIAGTIKIPKRVIGMHFFIPPTAMKLVEITPGLLTHDDVFKATTDFAGKLGKIPVRAPDSAGFLVNRLLVQMLNEAAYLVMEGNAPEDIDRAMTLGANLPMGPLMLADFAGLDTVLATMTQIYEEFGESKYRPCPLLKKMVRAGFLGRKTKRGFYRYD
jgi:3-hydroxybutyryl-CoA dehydrogenase